jgi:hypothetical protein
MIILEQEQSYLMITQHDHARVSGQIAGSWNEEFFLGLDRKNDVVLSCYEHDRGWIELDKAPKWHPSKQQPFSFMDYPPRNLK